MTYVRSYCGLHSLPVRASGNIRMGLGDVLATIGSFVLGGESGAWLRSALDQQEEMACLNKANASGRVAEIDAKTDDLSKNWRPTGFYTPAEMTSLVSAIVAYSTEAAVPLATAPRSTSDAEQQIRQAQAYLARNIERSKMYQGAVATAKRDGSAAIDAPGFRDWVINSLVNISQAFVTVAVLQCRTSWLDRAAAIAKAISDLAKRVAGVVLKAGETLVKVADRSLDIVQYVPYIAAGVGLWFVFSKLKKRV